MIFATDEHRLAQIQCKQICSGGRLSRISWVPQATRLPLQDLRHPRYPRLDLWLDCDLSLDRIGDETLLVRGMIHFLDFLRRWLFVSREFEFLF
jgi:hypothetical protein